VTDVVGTGRGSRAKPVVVEAPVLVAALSERDRAAAVAVLTEILSAWWLRQQATIVGGPET
jgi:hypothetical protein